MKVELQHSPIKKLRLSLTYEDVVELSKGFSVQEVFYDLGTKTLIEVESSSV